MMNSEAVKTLLVETFAASLAADDGEISADGELSKDLEKVFRAVTSDVVLSSIVCAIASGELSDSIDRARAHIRNLGCLMMA